MLICCIVNICGVVYRWTYGNGSQSLIWYGCQTTFQIRINCQNADWRAIRGRKQIGPRHFGKFIDQFGHLFTSTAVAIMAPSRSEMRGSLDKDSWHSNAAVLSSFQLSSKSHCTSQQQQRSASHPNITAHNGFGAGDVGKRKSHRSMPCSVEQYTRPTAMCNGKQQVGAGGVGSSSDGGRSHQVQMEKRFRLFKTEICRTFEETGSCKYGSKCQFAHSQEELRPIPRHPRYKTEVCRTFWEQGTCPYGKRCCFIHNEHSLIDSSANSSNNSLSTSGRHSSLSTTSSLLTATAAAESAATVKGTSSIAMSSQPFPEVISSTPISAPGSATISAAYSTTIFDTELFDDADDLGQDSFGFSTSSMKSLSDTTRVVLSISRRASVEQQASNFSNNSLWCDDQMMMVSSLAVARRPSVPHGVILCPMSSEDGRSDLDPHGVLRLLDDE